MDTLTTAPVHGHSTYEEDPLHQHGHGVALQSGGHEEHHEKKSVLKKVKAKAKKIKETITGHGHLEDHDHDHHNEHDDEEEDDDEEEEEEEEIVEDPEVHGAPMYESAAARDFARRDDVNLGKPKVVWSEQVGSVQLEEDPHAPKGPFHGVAPANYQTKVADPTGRGGEVDVDPIIRQFGKMGVHVEPEDRDKFPVTGSTKTQTNPPNTQSVPGSLNISNSNEPTPHHQSSSYTDKISSATSVIADKAISAKNVVASKLGYGAGNDNVTAPDSNKDQHHSGGTGTGTGVTDYGRQIAATVTDKLAPVYGKVAEAGSAVASKIQGTATETQRGTGSHPDIDVNRGIETHTGAGTAGAVTDTHPTTGAGAGASAGVRIKGYLAEKLKPGEEDKALSEVISDALHKRKGEEEGKDGVDRPMGKVTESEQVARRLGTDTDESGGTGNESPGKSYVNRLKGALTSWWGKGGETDPSQAIQDNRAHGTLGDQMSGGGGIKDEGDGHENVGERNLQGSTS